VHLLGVGDVIDIFTGIKHGIDTFDCVQPTRLARHGWALMPGEAGGRINLRNARFRDDPTPLDPINQDSPDGKRHEPTGNYSRAYLHHLIKAGEILAIQILVEHNVSVMMRMMRDIRRAIREDDLPETENRWLKFLPPVELNRTYGESRE
jgi:queuine tRNA-ribosyltransferase